jgi:hypothetical protein
MPNRQLTGLEILLPHTKLVLVGIKLFVPLHGKEES